MNVNFPQTHLFSKNLTSQGGNHRKFSKKQLAVRFGNTELSCEEKELFTAAKIGRIDIVTQLLKNGINPNVRDSHENTPLHWAAGKGNSMTMGVLLGARGSISNPINQHGYSPLAVAVTNGQAECVDKMLMPRFSVDINQTVKALNHDNPLLIAISNGDKEIVERLLRSPHININAQNDSGETPLMRAAETGQLSMVQLLLSRRDLDVNLLNNAGETARDIAFKSGQQEINELIWQRQDRPLG